MSNYTGSNWKKWDLHIHTPFTKLYDGYKSTSNENVWKVFCDKIENSDVAVFGITDYFCIDNYVTFIRTFQSYYPSSKKVFFPNIEFRLEVSVNRSAEEVNIHIIFSNDIPVAKIEQFLHKLNTNLTDNGAKISCKNLPKAHFQAAAIDYKDIIPALDEVFGNHKCYLIIAACNNTGLRADTRSPRKMGISDEIDKICDAFFGGQQNVSHFLKSDRFENDEESMPKPVISGSDAHSFEDMDAYLGKRFKILNQTTGKEDIVKDITWIKADMTFEGLKQITFEPSHRISIGEITPREALRRIEKIQFNFPQTIKIKRSSASTFQELCIKDLKKEIPFSSYFTCLIGGRGTGKSTIINLIAERLGYQTDFFSPQNNSLYENFKNPYDLKVDQNNYVKIVGTNDIEFVSQGKVEELTEGEALTKLIFIERILQTDIHLQDLKQKISDIKSIIDDQIELLFHNYRLSEQIELKNREKISYESVINSINDPKYEQITNAIKEIASSQNKIKRSKQRYEVLIEKLKLIIVETVAHSVDNSYERRINEIINYIKNIDEIVEKDDILYTFLKTFDDVEEENLRLQSELLGKQKDLSDFFKDKGTSAENIKDSQNANTNLSRIQAQIVSFQEQLNGVNFKVQENVVAVERLNDISDEVQIKFQEKVGELNKKLDRKNENVSKISYTYKYNYNKFKHSLFEEFKELFKGYHIANTSWDSVRDLLFEVSPEKDVLGSSYETFYNLINDIIDKKSFNRNNNYVIILLNIFSIRQNFVVYQYLVKKHFFDVFENIHIQGFYGSRELVNCSFGQKCTAVIVTLLMTGVKPLLIDEPEAHLDNRLIADYLVDLIKETKNDRQLIFATHNANFVVNGDAELIYILEIPDNENCTIVSSTSIEDRSQRDKLLKLEGGKTAFEKRERRLL